jgi:Ca2+-binding RTX toxin-like protein
MPAPTPDDILEAAKLAAAVYGGDPHGTYSAEEAFGDIGWSAIDLDDLDPVFGLGSRYQIKDGYFDIGIVQIGVAEKDGVWAVSFRGTTASEIGDWLLNLKNFSGEMSAYDYFEIFVQPFFDSVLDAATNAGVEKIIVTGHSQGGVLAESALRYSDDDRLTGVTFGSPGTFLDSFYDVDDNRIVNIGHQDGSGSGDLVFNSTILETRLGHDLSVDLQDEDDDLLEQHAVERYRETAELIADALSDASLADGYASISIRDFDSAVIGTSVESRVLVGDEYANIVLGDEGDDDIAAGAGNDLVVGGVCNDSLAGGRGEDLIFGSEDEDFIQGGDGGDTLFGDGLDPTLGSKDWLFGDMGNDTLHGGGGEDTLYGNGDNDQLFGGEGNDTLSGGDGNDWLDGGRGEDVLLLDQGEDVLVGGPDDDTYIISGSIGGTNTIVDVGSGNTLIFQTAQPGDLTFRKEGRDLLVTDNGGADAVRLSAFFLNDASVPEQASYHDWTVRTGTTVLPLSQILASIPENDWGPVPPPPAPADPAEDIGRGVEIREAPVTLAPGESVDVQDLIDFISGSWNDFDLIRIEDRRGQSYSGRLSENGDDFEQGAEVWAWTDSGRSHPNYEDDRLSSDIDLDDLRFEGGQGQNDLRFVFYAYDANGDLELWSYEGTNLSFTTSVYSTEAPNTDAPSLATTNLQTTADAELPLQLSASDSQTDNPMVEVEILTAPGNGRLELFGESYFAGDTVNVASSILDEIKFVGGARDETYQLRARAFDGSLHSDWASFTITVANQAPATTPDSLNLAPGVARPITESLLLRNDVDIDGDEITLLSISSTDEINVTSTGNAWLFEADRNAKGTQTLSYVVSDGTDTATGVISVTVSIPDWRLSELDDVFQLEAGFGSIFGLGGNDTLTGGAWQDEIDGGAGQDLLNGLGGNDTLRGGDGLDTLYGGRGADFLFGGDAADTLYGEGGVDVLWGQDGTDFIDGGASGDVIRGGRGDDSIYGRAGNDTIRGEEGADLLSGGGGADFLFGGDEGDTLFGEAGVDVLWGQDGVDFIDGGGSGDMIRGGRGDDTITGRTGEDTIHGEDGNDSIFGGYDGDLIYGDSGRDLLDGFNGNDEIWGGDDGDRLVGGRGDDVLYGGHGKDFLVGSDGDDTMTGGTGGDSFFYYVRAGAGEDTITDFNSFNDAIVLFDSGFDDFAAVLAATSDVNGDAVITLGAGQTLTLSGVTKASLQSDDIRLETTGGGADANAIGTSRSGDGRFDVTGPSDTFNLADLPARVALDEAGALAPDLSWLMVEGPEDMQGRQMEGLNGGMSLAVNTDAFGWDGATDQTGAFWDHFA